MSKAEHFIIMRYVRASYYALGGIEAHGKRQGGDLEHVDSSRSHRNEFLVGDENLREIANAHIARMQQDNAARKIAGLRKSRHKKQARELETAIDVAGDDPFALAEVIGWPWDPKNTKPFTEGFLSISHEWFLDDDGHEDPAKLDAFRSFVVGYLEEEFGGEVLYARLDLDEKTPHVSFVVAPEHENRKTKRRELSHHKHRLFGMKEVQVLFDDEEPDPKQTRRSYELLQDRVADYAAREGLDVRRGHRRADAERMQRALGETVVKRNHVTPAEGRAIAAAEAAEAAKANEEAQAAREEARRERKRARAERKAAGKAVADAKATREAAEAQRKAALARMEEVHAEAEAIMVGTQAIIAEEIAYAPPTPEKAEGLTWGRNKPESKERRSWLSEKIKPARRWLIGFARSVFGFQKERDEVLADQKKRAEAIVEAERKQGRDAPLSMLDVIGDVEHVEDRQLEIPGAWAVPKDMKPRELDKHLAGMTNTEICDAFAPTRDARDFSVHTEMHERYDAGVSHLLKEAKRRGLDIEERAHRPEKATDPERAKLHKDSPPAPPMKVRRQNITRQRVI